MKPSEFYADYQSTTVGVTGLTFTEKWTQPALNIYNAQTPNNFSTEAYYLGWISYDNLPIIMGHHSVTVDAENDSIVFVDDTIKDNYPCGYLQQNNQYNAQIFVEDGVVIPGISNYTPSMYNDLHPEYSALNAAALQFRYYEKINGEIVPRSSIVSDMPGGVIRFGYSQPNTLQELFDFLEGTSTITYTLGNYTYDFDASQLEEGYGEFVSNEDETHSIIIFLSPITPYAPRFSRGAGSGDLPSAFFATVKYEDSSEEEHSYDVVLANDNIPSWGLGGFYWNDYSFSVHNNIKYSGKVSGEFKISDLLSMSATTGYAISGNIFAFCLYGSGGSNPRTFFSILSNPADMLRTLSLNYRVDFSGTNPPTATYVDGVTYATNVTADDEFLAELKTGNISDDEFRNGLRYWQYSSIANNDFDEDEIPPYEPEPEPPGPTPQETEPKYPGFPTLGGSTRYVPTAGVNFYALNNSLVSSFVQRLWSQPKNFYEAIQIAGNQVDSIFDYIQSFRYYPLNFNFSGQNTYPVIFGTGAVLKEADGNTNFQLSEASPIQTTITAGNWNLNASIYHWRNNFLDYSPYLKMSIYLPFAGTIELSPEAVASHTDISAATISLLASFDIETGTITYYVVNQANVILAQKTAKVAIDLPLSGNNSAEQSAAILRAQFSTVKQLLGAGSNIVSGAATSGVAGAAAGAVSTLGSLGDMYLQNSLAQRAVPVEVQGMGGTFSALAGGQYPYITINRQKVSNPPNYAHTTGYLVEGTYKISSLNGLTVCRNIDVSGISQATDKEKAEIKKILESGFYA